jgi:hypothetical protein
MSAWCKGADAFLTAIVMLMHLQYAGPGAKDKFMLVSPDDSCELFYRAKKVEEGKDSITIEYLDLPSLAVSADFHRAQPLLKQNRRGQHGCRQTLASADAASIIACT